MKTRITNLGELLEQAKSATPPTESQKQEQALSFAYANLALTDNHKPAMEGFWIVASERYGWTRERFEDWAAGRQWWTREEEAT